PESENGFEAPEVVLRRERDEYLDMVRRVQADFENYKKRMVRQQTDLLERAAEGLVVQLLPVLDAFEMARAHLGADGESTPEGKALLQAAGLLSDTLAKVGLELIADEGVAFDPTTHEAVEHEEGAGAPADGAPDVAGADDAQGADVGSGDEGPSVTGVLRAGYRYKGKVVRPAMVRVRG
ncbi:MAG: nucleotide exchange factor GrpE, partial [Acidimicrobiales bacterium]